MRTTYNHIRWLLACEERMAVPARGLIMNSQHAHLTSELWVQSTNLPRNTRVYPYSGSDSRIPMLRFPVSHAMRMRVQCTTASARRGIPLVARYCDRTSIFGKLISRRGEGVHAREIICVTQGQERSVLNTPVVYLSAKVCIWIDLRLPFSQLRVAMAPYKILKQGYIMKEPPASKRGLRRVSGRNGLHIHRRVHVTSSCELVWDAGAVACWQDNYLHSGGCCANLQALVLICCVCVAVDNVITKPRYLEKIIYLKARGLTHA